MSREALEAAAKEVAEYANRCCHRSDGYEEDVEALVLAKLQAAQADAYERAAKVCETAEVPIDIDVWMGTKKALTAATAIGLATAIRKRSNQ